MSRSRKHEPGGGMTIADSDKPFKRTEHRRERRQVKAALLNGEEPKPRVYGDPWNAPKDGKQYWVDPDPKWMRK